MLSARMCHHDCVGDELGRVEEYNVVGKPSRRGARLVKMEAKQRWQASVMHSPADLGDVLYPADLAVPVTLFDLCHGPRDDFAFFPVQNPEPRHVLQLFADLMFQGERNVTTDE